MKIKYIFILVVIILIIPHFIRFLNGNILIGEESYYHAKIAKEIIDGNFQGTPYHYILALFMFIFGGFAFKLLPFLLGMLSLLLFYLIFKKYFRKSIFYILFILIISPAFIYTFTVLNIHSFFIFLILLFVYLLKKKKVNIILSIIFFFFIIYNIASYNIGYLEKDKDFIMELGAKIGFGIFNLLLALIGLILFRGKRKRKKSYLIYLTIILILIISYYYIGNISNIYLNFILAIFSGLAFYLLINLKWSSKLIKNLTFIVLVIGLFFSCIIYVDQLTKSMPNKDIIDALEYLKNLEGYNVLSHYPNGFWIEYYDKKNIDERFDDINFVFESYDLKKTKEKLDKYKINYIFITPKMKAKGLLFLLRNKETFKNIYEWNDVEVWQIK